MDVEIFLLFYFFNFDGFVVVWFSISSLIMLIDIWGNWVRVGGILIVIMGDISVIMFFFVWLGLLIYLVNID